MKKVPIQFRVVAISSNANSFGLRGHILMDRTGRTFQAGRTISSGIPQLQQGEDITLVETFDEAGNPTGINWAESSFEIPQLLEKPPRKVIDEVFKDSN